MFITFASPTTTRIITEKKNGSARDFQVVGAKQKAATMVHSMLEKYSYLEKSEHPAKMADYLKMWKEMQANEVAETT
jgi:hypothetical protein